MNDASDPFAIPRAKLQQLVLQEVQKQARLVCRSIERRAKSRSGLPISVGNCYFDGGEKTLFWVVSNIHTDDKQLAYVIPVVDSVPLHIDMGSVHRTVADGWSPRAYMLIGCGEWKHENDLGTVVDYRPDLGEVAAHTISSWFTTAS